MRTIWKCDLVNYTPGEIIQLALPIESKFLHLDRQREDVNVWFEVDPDKVGTYRHLTVVGTGQEIPKNAEYLATFLEMDGLLVWHLFDLGEHHPE